MKKEIKPLAELLDSVRHIEGFPIGKDEDILALSDPPYYTACPNPYLNDFIAEHGKPYDEATDNYHKEPFVSDVSEGKNDPIYNAHSYHTKVPHKAIMKYIEHYTEAGDIVFDGFCGTGMTGVAAQLLNRKAILSDLSPIATFIAYNYNKKVDVDAFEREAKRILQEVETECGWMYETDHTEGTLPQTGTQLDFVGKTKNVKKGKINYTVWSDVFLCPYCAQEIVFWEAAVDKEKGAVKKDFPCPHCHATTKKTDCQRATVTFFDTAIGQEITQAKQVPVLINYSFGKKRFEKTPDANDLALIEKIEQREIPYWFPTDPMMNVGDKWGDTWRKGVHFGITYVHHFYTKRNLWILSAIFNQCSNKSMAQAWFTSCITRLTKMYKYMPVLSNGRITDRRTGTVSGTLYIPSMSDENSPLISFGNKINDFMNLININKDNYLINTSSSTSLGFINNSVDYIFIDPPFGDNLMYSELNYNWESWLKVKTNNQTEAIVNNSQNKGLSEYSELVLKSFQEYYRVLKPNRWITVEFHNSKSSVWNAIQDAMSKAGFVVANVSTLDKQQGSFKQVTSAGATKNDLVISAYKPKQQFERRFLEMAGEGLEEEFIKMHLSHLPAEPGVERTEQMLYSKLLAYYVQRSYVVKYDATSFYKMLHQKFTEEDGYWFNPEQIGAYREYKKKMKMEGSEAFRTGQMVLFVSDEKSALIWLHGFLSEPKDFKAIHPAFTKLANISGDQVPDLRDLLENNFIRESDLYRRPQTEDEKLSVTQHRERELLREFEKLLLEAKGSKRKIKECRKQAVVFGFELCYKQNRFEDIITLARRLDSQIIENDSEIKEFVEVAELKVEGF